MVLIFIFMGVLTTNSDKELFKQHAQKELCCEHMKAFFWSPCTQPELLLLKQHCVFAFSRFSSSGRCNIYSFLNKQPKASLYKVLITLGFSVFTVIHLWLSPLWIFSDGPFELERKWGSTLVSKCATMKATWLEKCIHKPQRHTWHLMASLTGTSNLISYQHFWFRNMF